MRIRDPASLYDIAVAVAARKDRIGTAGLQRALCSVLGGAAVGYNRCALLLAQMEQAGLVGRVASDGRRDVRTRLQ